MTLAAHTRILFYAKTASQYTRGIADELLTTEVVASSTLKDIDPQTLLALQSKCPLISHHTCINFSSYFFNILSSLRLVSLRQYLRKIKKVKGENDLDFACEKFSHICTLSSPTSDKDRKNTGYPRE